jgi:hypothetical protein
MSALLGIFMTHASTPAAEFEKLGEPFGDDVNGSNLAGRDASADFDYRSRIEVGMWNVAGPVEVVRWRDVRGNADGGWT